MPSDLLEIVVVEDDPSMRRAIERMLRVGGFRPIMFGSAEASIEAGILLTADCLILDIQLPGMSGLDLFEYSLADGDSPPTIFITSFDSSAFRDRAGRLGAISYHQKPFLGRVLLDAVKQALQAPRENCRLNE
ncbi:Response regulator protein TmoT [Novipirellula aureliae]|uniref:Response regulator protein TmoT n=1 Tax=Novipirellula aureliae TaxID=2527966 RepID=A0A5C6DBU0_9BACT|nr:response regulator [Novipirellula aureliae]TWU33665.1 Response regulator protein TmoT [Novipirellula aureliae]